MAKLNITSPVARLVMGSLYTPKETDGEDKPLVFKTGPNIGKPRVDYFFAIAIPKEAGHTHWAHTAWGAQIWALGHAAFPQAAQAEEFSWKIIDGDSRKPGKLYKGKPGKPPCENEGWPGHWILKLSGGYAPKVYRQEGAGYVQMLEVDAVKPGHFVEVAFSVDGNGSQSSPGIYINHSMVCFRAYGPEISFGPDVASAGFGQSPLPAGASMAPPPSTAPMPAGAPAAPAPLPPGVPVIPGAPAPLAPAGSVPAQPTPAPAAPAPIQVIPNPQFVQMPAPPVAPPAAPAAPVTPVRQMTAAANGITYEAYIANNWTDALLVQNGLMLA